MKKACHLVIAPHPDDETLGCGGTLLRAAAAGEPIHWVVVTAMTSAYPAARRRARRAEIAAVRKDYPFTSLAELGLPAGGLTDAHMAGLVAALAEAVRRSGASHLYLPHAGDPHSDHRVVHAAGAACAKWFRAPGLRRVLSYETPSETDQGLLAPAFVPNVFTDVSGRMERKLAILRRYRSEVSHPAPFPRSPEAVRSLAAVRGSAAGFAAAEAFVLLRERL